MQNYALTSPKPQTYIEKDPIGPSKQLRAPRSAVACRLFSPPETMPLHHLHTNVHRESPHLFQNRLWPCGGRRPESDPAGVFSLKNNAPTSPLYKRI